MKPFVLVLLAAGSVGQGDDLHFDFRGGNLHPSRFRVPPEWAEYVTPEERGIRIDVPAKAGVKEAGFNYRTEAFPLTGNLAITVSYELLASDDGGGPTWGPGFQMYVMLNNSPDPKKLYLGDGITLARQVRGKLGDVIAFTHMATDADGTRVRRTSGYEQVDAMTRSGRLRLSRNGETMTAEYAVGLGEAPWRKLGEFPIGPDNLRMLRLAAEPSSMFYHVDARVIDVDIKTDGAAAANTRPNAPALGEAKAITATASERGASAAPESGRRHVLWVLLIVTGLLMISAGVVWAWRSNRAASRTEPSRSQPAAPKKT